MRFTIISAGVATLLLAGCDQGANDQPAAVPAEERAETPAAVTPPAEPPAEATGMRWETAASGEGRVARLLDAQGELVLSFACLANPQRLRVTVPSFTRIDSEDRLSFGINDDPIALAADMRGPLQGGITAEGPIPSDIAKRIQGARTIGANYGRFYVGPYGAPPQTISKTMAESCGNITAADPAVLEEKPAASDSPQAAATVTETYFALLADRKYEEAYRLWGDEGRASGMTLEEFRRRFAPYASFQGQVYAPGSPEGSAGSVFVAVPVSVTAKRTDGTTVSFAGSVTLRRVNDVPGSTPAQRRWHISTIALEPRPASADTVHR